MLITKSIIRKRAGEEARQSQSGGDRAREEDGWRRSWVRASVEGTQLRVDGKAGRHRVDEVGSIPVLYRKVDVIIGITVTSIKIHVSLHLRICRVPFKE